MSTERASDLVIRAPRPDEFDTWAELYRGYRAFYEYAPDESVLRRVWGWLHDDATELHALVAARGDQLLGLAHSRRFVEPSSGTIGLSLDDLFTTPDARGQGVGRALIAALSTKAAAEGLSVVTWITDVHNATARRLYDSVATATQWVTYELKPESGG